MMRTAGPRGTTFQRKSDGLWTYKIDLPRDTDGKRRVKSITCKTREGLDAKVAAFLAATELAREDRAYPVQGRRANLKEARKLGRHTRDEWDRKVRRQMDQQTYRCEYCGDGAVKTFVDGVGRIHTLPDLVKDHRVPVCRGGSDSIDNIAAVCKRCNDAKGTRTESEFLGTGGSVLSHA